MSPCHDLPNPQFWADVHFPTFLDQKFRWLAIPGLIRIIAILQAAFFVVMIFNPAGIGLIYANWPLVLEGEVWRIFSFVLIPPVPYNGGDLVFPVFWMLITVMVSFLISDVLEQAWGVTRTTIFVLSLMLCQGVLFPILAFWLLDFELLPVSYTHLTLPTTPYV